MMAIKRRIVAAFDDAEGYDAHASVQRLAAKSLARRMLALPLPSQCRILEIGCGTGFLAAAIGNRLAEADWLMTDISAAMVERARERFGDSGPYRYAIVDGEDPQADIAEPPFDLICSNLAFQWFGDLPGALQQLFPLVRPGGYLLFSTLIEGTFREWRQAHRSLGLIEGTPAYPAPGRLAELRLDGAAGEIECESRTQEHSDAGQFLRTVRSIGAGTPVPAHRPLPPSGLRRVMREFDKAGARATYRIAYCCFRRPGGSA